jgi:COP9 signalosome complex subunit 2
LSISADEVEDILVALILDGKIKGQIDQVAGRLELDHK